MVSSGDPDTARSRSQVRGTPLRVMLIRGVFRKVRPSGEALPCPGKSPRGETGTHDQGERRTALPSSTGRGITPLHIPKYTQPARGGKQNSGNFAAKIRRSLYPDGTASAAANAPPRSKESEV